MQNTAPIQTSPPQDRHRPVYHFSPPIGTWGGGPDGTIYHHGYYHIFYQYNPYMYSPSGNTHWGHVVSPDLVHWEHRPIALAPNPLTPELQLSLAESDLTHTIDRTKLPMIVNDRTCCYSGSAVINNGIPTVVYTSYTHGLPDEPVMRGRAQSIATSDDDMLTWTKRSEPIIDHPPHEIVDPELRKSPINWSSRRRVDDHLQRGQLTAWHDPHVWGSNNDWNLILGSGFMGIGGAVLLYRSRNLLDWEYQHPLCVGDQPEFNRWLVPDFFPLDGRNILLTVATTRGSSSKKIYQIGHYKNHKFYPEDEGFTDSDDAELGPFGCARTLTAPDGRCILFGRISEQRPHDTNLFGWASVLSLPRVLSVGENGLLRMEPAHEICESGQPDWEITDTKISPECPIDSGLNDDALEIKAEISPRNARSVGLRVRRSPDGQEETTIRYEPATDRLTIQLDKASLDPRVNGKTIGTTAHASTDSTLRLHVFLDRSVLEVFCGGRSCLSARLYPTRQDSTGIQAFAERGNATLDVMTVWRKQSIGLYC